LFVGDICQRTIEVKTSDAVYVCLRQLGQSRMTANLHDDVVPITLISGTFAVLHTQNPLVYNATATKKVIAPTEFPTSCCSPDNAILIGTCHDRSYQAKCSAIFLV